MTRVLVLSDLWLPFPGGAERLMFNLARDLGRRGADVTVLTGYGPALQGDGAPVLVEDLGVRDTHAQGVEVLRYVIHNLRPDVLLVHHFYAYEFEAELEASRLPVVQVVLNTRRLACASLAVFISRYVRDQHAYQPQDLIITPPAFSDVVAARHGHHIGFIKPIEHKGIEMVYALATAMPERQFLILRGEWQNIEEIRPAPNITFMEPVVDIRDFYAECRIVLVPSVSEDAGTVAQEAAMNGLPCLSSAVGGLLETNEGGVLLSPSDLSAWHQAICEMDDPARYAEVVLSQTLALADVGHDLRLAELAGRIDALAKQ